MPNETIRWGILGPGRIARLFATGLREARGAALTAVGSRDPARAAAFAAEFGAPRAYSQYEDLVADPHVDAIYVGTPHALHQAHTIMSLEAGKHVLCEKPLAIDAGQAQRMIAAAAAHDRAVMEAMWTRFLPSWMAVSELVARGAVGDIRLVQSEFGFRTPFDAGSRLFDPRLGGGALLDLGVYPLNLAVRFCGAPREIHATATIGASGVDEETAILMSHAGDRVSMSSCSFRADSPGVATIIGTGGTITVHRPWWAASRFTVRTGNDKEEVFAIPPRGGGFTHEAEAFMDLIRSRRRESAIMPLRESLTVIEAMDRIRDRLGVRYPGE